MTKKQYNLLVQAYNELEKLSKACPDDACDSDTLSTAADALEEVCEACGLERSSVYRYRTRALKKLAAALYGEGEVI